MCCSECVVAVDIAIRSKLFCECLVVLLFLCIESDVLKKKNIACTSGPITSGARVTFFPRSFSNSAATGASENAGFFCPLGRPRCVITTSDAPLSRIYLIVGRAALIRVLSVTTPSLRGTLKSTLIRTLLPLRSASLIVLSTMIVSF